jgi:dihydrofolate synthase/folylpolyglutamate synthase
LENLTTLDFEQLFLKRSSVIKAGLDNVRNAYEELGRPAEGIPTILIGGTNGKGSTVQYLVSLLATRWRVGFFTSPHLRFFRERIQCTHLNVTDEFIKKNWTWVKESLSSETYDILSFFEVTTLIGLKTFDEADCDVLVLEVGLGGRWDATNMVEPVMSAVASLGYDHQEFLGDDLLSIAREKFGIARPGRSLLLGASDEVTPQLEAEIAALARETGAHLWQYGEHYAVEDGLVKLCFADDQVKTFGLPEGIKAEAHFLQRNFALACAVYERLVKEERLPGVPGLAQALNQSSHFSKPAGRFHEFTAQVEGQKLEVIIDVAHNVSGVKSLIRSLKLRGVGSDSPCLVSILKDKDIDGMLDVLEGFFDTIVLFRIEHERSWNDAQLEGRPRRYQVFDRFEDAWAFCNRKEAAARRVICGSVLAVGSVLEYFHIGQDKILFGDGVVQPDAGSFVRATSP